MHAGRTCSGRGGIYVLLRAYRLAILAGNWSICSSTSLKSVWPKFNLLL